ncbi:MAG: MnhB domain-containing protein [Bacteroidales bacterium]|jgi:multicomponent Na+:H+ antiporter subunit B|nr:MnhB domain-containing protein [Bacteroidales bacterium]
MRNLILRKISKLYLLAMVTFSVFILLRGHNNPGGGFIGGIITSTGFIFYGIINGSESVKRLLRISTIELMGAGLLAGIIALMIPLFSGLEPFTGLWLDVRITAGMVLHLGTPLLFDTGIYLVVTGVILSIIISIMDVVKWN